MPKNRQAAEAVILKRIEQMAPSGPTPDIYRAMFAKMDDVAFEAFMDRLKTKQNRLAIIAPNGDDAKLTIDNALKMADEMGHNFYQRLWIKPNDGKTPAFLTPKAYLVLDLPGRRQAQLLEKKARIPKHNRSIDELTGQAAGESKGSKLSSTEMQVLAALDLPSVITEQIKYRGGDIKGFDAMNNMIDKTGAASMASIQHLAGGVESTKTLETYLTAMHLKATGLT